MGNEATDKKVVEPIVSLADDSGQTESVTGSTPIPGTELASNVQPESVTSGTPIPGTAAKGTAAG